MLGDTPNVILREQCHPEATIFSGVTIEMSQKYGEKELND